MLFELDGIKYFIQEINPITQHYRLGTYEKGIRNLLSNILQRGNTFIDVGAHIGYHSFFAAKIVGKRGKVISFEPDPNSYNLLKRGMIKNKFKNVILEESLVSNKNGTSLFYIMGSGLSSLISPQKRIDKIFGNLIRKIQVRTISLDGYCSTNNVVPDCIKIDTEGAENEVLEGMENLLGHYSPKLIIDLHGNSNQKIIEKLINLKYQTFFIRENCSFDSIKNSNMLKKKELSIYSKKKN